MPPKKRITHGISFPEQELLDLAKQKAASLQISFSAYINQLVRKDLGYKSVLDWETGLGPVSAHRQKKGRFKEPSLLDQRDAGAE